MNMLRSAILTELVSRWLTKVATLVAIYMTSRGHNAPGGGFAGGLVLGAAFVLQFLAGQQPAIRRRPIRQPAALLGVGLLLSLGTTVAPLLVGAAALESHIWILELPLIGNVKVVSSTFFDIGVLFVVVAVVLLILQFLGERGAALMDDSVGGES